MTKSFYLLTLACVLSLHLFTIASAQSLGPSDFDLDFDVEGNEEWDVGENEECYFEEEMNFDVDINIDVSVPVENAIVAGKSVNCEQQYAIVEGDICDNIAQANGVSVDDLKNLNDGLNCDALQIGQTICVKGSVQENPSPPSPPPPAGAINFSFEQFTKAVTKTNNYPAPSQDHYNRFINGYSKAEISTPRELAMFLAEVLWESGGLQHKAEVRCQADGCPTEYRVDTDDPTKFYYGRGYIQLTWSDNYRQASQDIFGDDRLVQDPDQIANNEDVAWETTFWYWRKNVHPAPGVQDGQFGSATNAINGKIECNPCKGNCSKRNDIYAAILPEFGVNEQPNFGGC